MVKNLKCYFHSLFIAMASISYVSTKKNLIAYHTQLHHNLTFATDICYSWTRHFLLSIFYSYKTATTSIEPSLVERRLSIAVEVMTATGNWNHPLPLKIIFSAVSNGYYVLEMADTQLLPHYVIQNAVLKCGLTYLYIYVSTYCVFH